MDIGNELRVIDVEETTVEPIEIEEMTIEVEAADNDGAVPRQA